MNVKDIGLCSPARLTWLRSISTRRVTRGWKVPTFFAIFSSTWRLLLVQSLRSCAVNMGVTAWATICRGIYVLVNILTNMSCGYVLGNVSWYICIGDYIADYVLEICRGGCVLVSMYWWMCIDNYVLGMCIGDMSCHIRIGEYILMNMSWGYVLGCKYTYMSWGYVLTTMSWTYMSWLYVLVICLGQQQVPLYRTSRGLGVTGLV